MFREYNENTIIPIKSWCEKIEKDAFTQAENLANHPAVFKHVALMPDCHVGYGMPIGGVIACEKAVIPNAVGVDIGCGMGAIETSVSSEELSDPRIVRNILNKIKEQIPVGEGNSHKHGTNWNEYENFKDSLNGIEPEWLNSKNENLDLRNLGSLGGGNHFLEMQKSETGKIWLMLHSGSRNLGYRIATYYHSKAMQLNERQEITLPDKNLAFLSIDEAEGISYIRDMEFALQYAAENRRRMMEIFKNVILDNFKDVKFSSEINIHHNYAAIEAHFGRKIWVHRKGATSAKSGEKGIIPGSMGTSSYIVEGLGNFDSFMSCSHGAGRIMGRQDACRRLSIEECDEAMRGIVFDRWNINKRFKGENSSKKYDLSESPLAYKNIDEVIHNELDLIKPLVKLSPIGVIKG